MELLIDRELVVTPQRLERIHQAIMFYADSVILRITSEVPAADARIAARLRELQEIGAVTTWAHEYEVDDGGRVRTGRWNSVLAGPAGQVVPLPQVKEVVREVNADLDLGENLDGPAALREGLAELVQFRQSVIAVRLADILAVDGMLTQRNWALGAAKDGPALPAAIRTGEPRPNHQYEAVAETIVELCTFGRLSDFPLDAIVNCRGHMPAFRRYLNDKMARPGYENPRRIAEEVVAEYHDLLARYAKGHEIRDLATDIGWDVVGALLPPAVFVRYLGKPIEWSKRRREFRPFLLLSRIREQQRRSEHERRKLPRPGSLESGEHDALESS